MKFLTCVLKVQANIFFSSKNWNHERLSMIETNIAYIDIVCMVKNMENYHESRYSTFTIFVI